MMLAANNILVCFAGASKTFFGVPSVGTRYTLRGKNSALLKSPIPADFLLLDLTFTFFPVSNSCFYVGIYASGVSCNAQRKRADNCCDHARFAAARCLQISSFFGQVPWRKISDLVCFSSKTHCL